MLDCGWTNPVGKKKTPALISKKVVNVHAILLSNPGAEYLGALPHVLHKNQFQNTIYATSQTQLNDQILIKQIVGMNQKSGCSITYNFKFISAVFSRAHHLWFRQIYEIETPPPFKGAKNIECEIAVYEWGLNPTRAIILLYINGAEILYEPGLFFKHKQQTQLNQSLSKTFRNSCNRKLIPRIYSCLIPLQHNPKICGNSHQRFLNLVFAVLRRNGNVLIPVSCSLMLLEIILIIGKFWQRNKVFFGFVLISKYGHWLLEKAKDALNLTNTYLLDSFHAYSLRHTKKTALQRTIHPFAPGSLKILKSKRDLKKLQPFPQIVITFATTLSMSACREILTEWAEDPRNALLFTNIAQKKIFKMKKIDLYQRIPWPNISFEDQRPKKNLRHREVVVRDKYSLSKTSIKEKFKKIDISDDRFNHFHCILMNGFIPNQLRKANEKFLFMKEDRQASTNKHKLSETVHHNMTFEELFKIKCFTRSLNVNLMVFDIPFETGELKIFQSLQLNSIYFY
jgi:predicted metal-dependent RNase